MLYRISLIRIIFFFVCIYSAILAWPTPVTAQNGETLLLGKPAPPFTLSDVNGKTVRLSDYKGNKNVMLVFYRGWIGNW